MKFSSVDVISIERSLIQNRKAAKKMNIIQRIYNSVLYPRNPRHSFSFCVPNYLYMRSLSFCDEVSCEFEDGFSLGDLSECLYLDFLEYAKQSNNMHEIHNRLKVRELSPPEIKPYQSESAYKGVLFEESRGYERIEVSLDHSAALRGEFLLRDMADIYNDHSFSLENILEIVFCDFVDDYRRGLIKNPVEKVLQYAE